MRAQWRHVFLAATLLAAAAQQAFAQTATAPAPLPRRGDLYGTTGACNNDFPGGPCQTKSTLVKVDLQTGATTVIGSVGFTVNGLAWDRFSKKMYASTAIGDVTFHGLITIDLATGAGKPVDPTVRNFGLAGADSPVHSVVIDPVLGTMQGWYDEFAPDGGPPPTGDTFVWINKFTGVATEFPDSGINTNLNGFAWQSLPTKVGGFTINVPHLWNIDSPKIDPVTFITTQTAYEINPLPFNTILGKPVPRVLSANVLSPPIVAALGDFNPLDNLYYGLQFTPFCPTCKTNIVQVDPQSGNVTLMAETLKSLHVLAFVK